MTDSCFICGVELNDGEHVYRAPTGYGGHIFCHIECVKRKIEVGERIFVNTITVDPDATTTMDIGDADDDISDVDAIVNIGAAKFPPGADDDYLA